MHEASIVRRGARKGQPCINIPSERRERLAAVGAERALAYRALFFTGLRMGELRSIRICDLHHERQRLGTGRQPAASKPAPSLGPQSPAFIVPSGFLRILNRDLAHAGIVKRSADGRTFDLHAFRTSLGTHLASAGVPLRTTQAVMRHSSPTLTANVHTDTDLLQVDAAVASLPSL